MGKSKKYWSIEGKKSHAKKLFSRINIDTSSNLQTMKISTLKQASEGKLIPQDLNDESAEILLQKIKQEKISKK
jgi:hypothetical protein